MHPDQHAIVFAPGNPDVAFIGSDGGVVRTSGAFANASTSCDTRGLIDPQLTQCHQWLSAIPTQIFSLNIGLATLQFQSLSINVNNPLKDIMGGTQDNGTWVFEGVGQGDEGSWFESVGGDGGQSGTDVASSSVRMHMYTGSAGDVNFNGTDPLGLDFMGDLLSGEAFSFYAPLINDPRVSGTWFIGGQHVWRTLDNAGPQAYLQQFCNEFFGAYNPSVTPCGDWEALGGPSGDLTVGPSSDKGTGYVVAVVRSPNDTGTAWLGTRRGRVWLSKNMDAAPASVTFTRIDTPSQPLRFVSGIAIDNRNSNHAWVSFSGYDAYTPTTPGHVFEVTVASGSVVWKNLSYNLGDQPITGIARDDNNGDLYVSTDFGVDVLRSGSTVWTAAGENLPPVSVYGLTIDSSAHVLYAATHGRSAWKLKLEK